MAQQVEPRPSRRRVAAVASHLLTPRRTGVASPAGASSAGDAGSRPAAELEYQELVRLSARSPEAIEAYEERRARVYGAFACHDSCLYRAVQQRGKTIIYRGIEFEEFAQKVNDIDRSESRTGHYRVTADGELELVAIPDELPDWDDERRAMHTERVRVCCERGGVIVAAFDLQPSSHQVMIGAAVLDGAWLNPDTGADTLDMYFLFASRNLRQKWVDRGGAPKDFRDAGIGSALFGSVAAEAKARGAENVFLGAFYVAMITLPRQAREKHRTS